jgi:serine/threonine protein kinase
MDLLIKVRDAKYRPISELQPGVPPELEAICDKCLTRSRANRYQTAAEAEGDLRAFLRRFMPNYSRSHLGRFIRKMFATEIERELRMLEEFVMTDDVSDDVGESMIQRDDDFEPPEVPFQPKPTSVSVAALENDFSSESNFTTMPKVGGDPALELHEAHTVILPDKGRAVARPRQPPPPPPRATAQRPKTQPPPIPPRRRATTAVPRGEYEEDVHAAPTLIIEVGRQRQRRRG